MPYFSTYEIEQKIRVLTGRKVGPIPRGQWQPELDWSKTNSDGKTAETLFDEWLKLVGVSDDKIFAMTMGGKARAYAAGRVWVEKNIVNEKPKPPARGPIIDIDPDNPTGFKPEEFSRGKSLAELLGETGTGKELVEKSGPTTSTSGTSQLDDVIRRAADAVIRPRIESAKNELLKATVEAGKRKFDEIKAELLDFNEQARDAIVDQARDKVTDYATEIVDMAASKMQALAIKAAEDFIAKAVPRRLEIKVGNEVKTLPAEARHEKFEEILFWHKMGSHVYLVGPYGTGKTHLFKQVAEALGYDLETEFFPIDQSLTKYDVKGYKSPLGEYVPTLVHKAVKNGGYMAIDEGDMWAAAALGSLNSILANDFGAFGDEVVQVHPRFLCIVAANTFGQGATRQYQGRNPLDAASLDRFSFVELDYDENLERQLYGNTLWTQYCQRVRKAARELNIHEAVPSMRGIARGNKALSAGGDPEMVQKAILWKGLAPDSVNKIKSIAGTFGKVELKIA